MIQPWRVAFVLVASHTDLVFCRTLPSLSQNLWRLSAKPENNRNYCYLLVAICFNITVWTNKRGELGGKFRESWVQKRSLFLCLKKLSNLGKYSRLINFFSYKKKKKKKKRKKRKKKREKKCFVNAVTRIRTWVIAATTQCTNHYTITAANPARWN